MKILFILLMAVLTGLTLATANIIFEGSTDSKEIGDYFLQQKQQNTEWTIISNQTDWRGSRIIREAEFCRTQTHTQLIKNEQNWYTCTTTGRESPCIRIGGRNNYGCQYNEQGYIRYCEGGKWVQ